MGACNACLSSLEQHEMRIAPEEALLGESRVRPVHLNSAEGAFAEASANIEALPDKIQVRSTSPRE